MLRNKVTPKLAVSHCHQHWGVMLTMAMGTLAMGMPCSPASGKSAACQ